MKIRAARVIGCVWLLGLTGAYLPSSFAATDLVYRANFQARFVPTERSARVCIDIDQDSGALRMLDLAVPEARYSNFTGDGKIQRVAQRVLWQVPNQGGRLCYRLLIDRLRGAAHDARITDHWAVLRLGDLFPPARVRTRRGALSESSVVLQGPEDWSFETRYGAVRRPTPVVEPKRRFDRPSGWLVAGKLGVRRDLIAGRRVTVAAPVGEGFRRLDMLALLRWTLPALVEVFPEMPERLLIVGANEGMWRGALSGPGSVYLHARRPLISENSTSSLLHELVHVATFVPSAHRDDWIVEGLAEYYSLEILRRAGGISADRYDQAFVGLSEWAEREHGGLSQPSTGADTAWAAVKLRALAAELAASGASLDRVVSALVEKRTLTRSALVGEARRALGRRSKVLADLPG
jgi:hypothetical protein